MSVFKSPVGLVAAAFVVCLLQVGCATETFRTHPDVAAKSQHIKKILLAPPQVKAYEISAGGMSQQKDDWSAQAAGNVSQALITRLGGSGLTVAVLTPDGANEQELREVQALYTAVAQSILTHTYSGNNNPNYFPEKKNQFDYSLGSLNTLLKDEGGDALLLVYGVDQFASAGKKALNVLGNITGVLAAAVTGVVILPRGEGTVLQMALADRDGRILWYNVRNGSSDLRDPSHCSEFVDSTLDAFPRVVK